MQRAPLVGLIAELTVGLALAAAPAIGAIGCINRGTPPCIAGEDWCADGWGSVEGVPFSSPEIYSGVGQCGNFS